MSSDSSIIKLSTLRKLERFKFNTRHSVSSQIKSQLQNVIQIHRCNKKEVSFHLDSPVKKKPIRIKSPDCKLSILSTKSSKKTSYSFHNPQTSAISDFSIINIKDQSCVRMQLVDWIMETASKLKLNRSVFYSTVSLMDTYFLNGNKQNKNLYVVGLVVLSLVCKLQYQNHITIQQCLQIIEYEITKQQFIDLQVCILAKMSFQLTPYTMFDRLIYHLQQLKSIFKQQLRKVKIIDFLNPSYFNQYLTICNRLDTILLSNIHKQYSLDSIIYSILQTMYCRHYTERQTKKFMIVYQNYWSHRHIIIQSERIKTLNSILLNISFNKESEPFPQGINHIDRIFKQTYCPKLKIFSQQILEPLSYNKNSIFA